MNKKKIIILCVLVLCFFIIIIKNINFSFMPSIKNFDCDNVSIEITKKDVSFTLVSQNGNWTVYANKTYKGKNNLCNAFAKKLHGIKFEELIATHKSDKKYGILSNAVKIIIKENNNKIVSIAFGSAVQNSSLVYASINNDDDVFLVSGILSSDLCISTEKFCDTK